jgi:hypothetical protein
MHETVFIYCSKRLKLILTCYLLVVADVYHVIEVADGDVTQDEQESGQDDLQVNILRILSKMFSSHIIQIGQKKC